MKLFGKRWLLVALGLAVVAVAIVAILHTPMAQRQVLGMAGQALDRVGIRMSADRLAFNLFSLEANLSGVTLASRDTPDQPFLTVDEAHVDLPWSLLWSELTFDLVELHRPRLSLRRSEAGMWNLPQSEEEAPPPTSAAATSPVPSIARLTIRSLAIQVDDQSAALGLDADPLDLEFESQTGDALTGTISLGRPAQVRIQKQATTLDRFDARLTLDDRDLEIDDLRLESPAGDLTAQGRVETLWGTPDLSLRYDGTLALGVLAQVLAADVPLGGQLSLSGEISGPTNLLAVTLDADSSTLRWSDWDGIGVHVSAAYEDAALTLPSFSLSIADGEVSGEGRINLGEPAAFSQLTLNWRDLDPDLLLRGVVTEPPVSISSALDGDLRATWPLSEPREIEATLTLRSHPGRTPRTGQLPVLGTAAFAVQERRWELDLDELSAPGVRVDGQVTGVIPEQEESLGNTRVQGDVRFDVEEFSTLADWVDAAGLVPDARQQQLSGRAVLTAALSGTVGMPTLSGRVDVSSLAVRGVGPIALAGSLAASPEDVSLNDMVVRLGENAADGRGSLNLDDGVVDGDLRLDFANLSAFAPLLPDAIAPDGALTGRISISGTTDEPHLQASFEGSRLDLGGRHLDQVLARIGLVGTELSLAQLFVQQGDGTLDVKGRYQIDSGAYTAELDGRQLRLSDLLGPDGPEEASPVEGVMNLTFAGSGTLESPGGTGRASIDQLVWSQRELGPLAAQLTLAEGGLRAIVELPAMRSRLEGALGLSPEDRSFDVTGEVAGLDLSQFQLAQADLPSLTGTLSAALTATGDSGDWSNVTGRVDLLALDGSIGDTPFALLAPATVDYRDEALRTDGFALSLSGSRLRIDGELPRADPGRFNLSLDGDLADFVALTRLSVSGDAAEAVADLDMTGAIRAQALVVGTLEQLEITADLDVEAASILAGAQPPVQDLNLRATYENAVLTLEGLGATWQGAQVSARGRLPVTLLVDELPGRLGPSAPSGPVHLEVDVTSITPEALTGFLDADTLADLGGELAVSIDIESDELTLESLRGALIITDGAITLAGIPLEQRRETRAEIADGQLRVAAFDWGNDQDYFTVGGTVDLGAEVAADLTVTAELDLRALSAFMTAAATEGDALLIANIQGPLDDPVINGTVELTGVGLRMAEPRLVVSNLNGALFLTSDAVQLYELIGEANGGPLRISGALQLDGLTPEGEILLVGRGIAMEAPEGLRTEVDTDVNLSLTSGEIALGGTVTVLRGAYREQLALTGGLLAALQEQESVTIVGLDEESPLDAVALNIRVITAEDIVIDNNYAALTVGTDVRVVGTAASPALTGRGALGEGGELRLGTRVYEIERGTVDFVDPSGIEPELDIVARTRVAGRDITVTIEGAPDTLTTSFQSDPPESESDIVSLLLTGRTLDEVGVAPGTAAREQALGLASGEFLGTAGQAVGLDTVRLEEGVSAGEIRFDSSLVATETNPGTRLTVGKNLSDQVQLIASQNLRESGLLTWIVEYLPRPNIELRLVIDDQTDRAYEFRHAISLGGPPRQLHVAAPRQPPRLVGDVQFSGHPGIPESELRDRLHLNEGDRFDFYRWQRDRDRLEILYEDRGFLEARIRPRRVEESDGTLTLTYEIIQGPLAILLIEGHELPDDVVATMRSSWTRAVFDGFLLDELRMQARQHLIADGFLQAQVEGEILEASDGSRKEIALQITAGPNISNRRILFSGNEQLTTERLQAFVAQQAIDQTAWVDEEPLVRALLGLYQAEGMLEAGVTVSEPEFAEDTATLPVRITEGPVFRVADITLQGLESLPLEAIQALVPPQAGDVYSGGDVSSARARVDRHFRQAGFNQVRVSAQSAVDRGDKTVSVVLDINEGPRQVVHEVELVGHNLTNERLISRALRIEPGQPVDVGAWNQARKRLYDTGAFRSVDIAAEPLDPSAADTDAGELPVQARVLLEEWPAYRLRYGLQLNDEEAPLSEQASRQFNLGFVGDLTRQNFIGRAITLGSAFRWDTDRRVIRGFSRMPLFFGLPITSTIFGSLENGTFGPADNLSVEDLSRLTLEQRFRPRPALTVAYSYNFERNHTAEKDFDPDDPFAFDITTDIARLDTSMVVDTRDDVFDATSGWFHSSNFEYGIESLGSDLRFAKYTGQQFHYWQIAPDLVFASAARVGLAAGFDQDLILSERFFAGGGNTVRGYGQDALGPLFFGEPDGGNASLVLNQELRFPIWGIFRGVGFIDAGNVFPLVENFTLSDLKVGAGVGLRINTPFGLFRFDFAAPLSEIQDERQSFFYFSIGQVF